MRRAVVTGGASGLGAATAARLCADGLEVVTADIASGADVALDVTDADAVARAAGEIGAVDVLVNAAGIIGANVPILDTTPDDWRRVFDVNVHGTVNMIRAFVPGMVERGWGRVINVASMAGKDGNPNLSIYSASKAAVIGRRDRVDEDAGAGELFAGRLRGLRDADERRDDARGACLGSRPTRCPSRPAPSTTSAEAGPRTDRARTFPGAAPGGASG